MLILLLVVLCSMQPVFVRWCRGVLGWRMGDVPGLLLVEGIDRVEAGRAWRRRLIEGIERVDRGRTCAGRRRDARPLRSAVAAVAAARPRPAPVAEGQLEAVVLKALTGAA